MEENEKKEMGDSKGVDRSEDINKGIMEKKIINMKKLKIEKNGGKGVMNMKKMKNEVKNGRKRKKIIKKRKRRCWGDKREEKRLKRKVVKVIRNIRI